MFRALSDWVVHVGTFYVYHSLVAWVVLDACNDSLKLYNFFVKLETALKLHLSRQSLKEVGRLLFLRDSCLVRAIEESEIFALILNQ